MSSQMWIVFNVYYAHQRSFTTILKDDNEMRLFCDEFISDNQKIYQQVLSYYEDTNKEDLRFLSKIVIEMSDIIYQQGLCDYVIEHILTGDEIKLIC